MMMTMMMTVILFNLFDTIAQRLDTLRDGPLKKLWGGEGNFRAAGIFFRYQIPCMNFF